MAVRAEVCGTLAPTIPQSSVDIRPLWTRVRSLDAAAFLAHVARLARKAVPAVADLIGDAGVVRAGWGGGNVETVIGKQVAILVIKTHLVDWTAKTLGAFLCNLHVLAIVRWGLAQVGRVEAEFSFADHVSVDVGASTSIALKEWKLDAFLDTESVPSVHLLHTVLIRFAVLAV